jgi:hypothetical protein
MVIWSYHCTCPLLNPQGSGWSLTRSLFPVLLPYCNLPAAVPGFQYASWKHFFLHVSLMQRAKSYLAELVTFKYDSN